jgi:hypothetical protein
MNSVLIGPFSQLISMRNLPLKGPLVDEQLEILEGAGMWVENGIIKSGVRDLDSDGIYDLYEFCGHISRKYFKPVDKLWGERTDKDPYTDMIFAMLEINGIELY